MSGRPPVLLAQEQAPSEARGGAAEVPWLAWGKQQPNLHSGERRGSPSLQLLAPGMLHWVGSPGRWHSTMV